MKGKKIPISTDSAVLLLLMLEWLLSLAAAYASGIAASLLAVLSYLVPIIVFLLFFATRDELLAHRPRTAGLVRTLPLLPIFLASVMLVSTLTGVAMRALSLPIHGGSAAGDNLLKSLLTHALLPAVLEEGLMRLCVLTLLARRARGQAIFQSALLFALMHASLYQLPYAFVGGVFLALAATVGGSFLYAVLFHLANNLLSLLMQKVPVWTGETAGLYINLAIALFVFLSAAFALIYLVKKKNMLNLFVESPRRWFAALLRSPLLLYLLLMLFFACL